MQQLEPKGKQHWEKDLERFWVFLHIMLSNRSLLSNRNKMQTMGGILNYLVMALKIKINSVQFSCSVMSDSFQLHGLQHASHPCPSLTPGAYSNSRPLSQWCHPTTSSSVISFSSYLQSFPESGSNESVLRIRWPKCWSFSYSISPSNEYSGLISFRMDWVGSPCSDL